LNWDPREPRTGADIEIILKRARLRDPAAGDWYDTIPPYQGARKINFLFADDPA